MSDNINETKGSKTDEIDIIDLFGRMARGIGKFLIWCYNALMQLFIFIIQLILFLSKKIVWIGVFSSIGIAVGILLFSVSKRYYTSELIAFSNSIDNKYIVSAVNLLNDPLRGGKETYDIVSQYLNLKEADVEKIKSIKAGYGIDEDFDGIVDRVDYDNTFRVKDSIGVKIKGIFYIQIEVFDEGIMDPIQEGILNYISKNKYLTEMNNTRILQQKQRIRNIDKEIDKLDSLQHIMYFETPKLKSTMPSDKLVFMNEIDQKLFHKDILELKQEKLEIEKELLVRGDAITILQPFTPTASPSNPILYFIILWGAVFCLLGIVIAILWQYRKSILGVLFNKNRSNEAVTQLSNILKIKNKS